MIAYKESILQNIKVDLSKKWSELARIEIVNSLRDIEDASTRVAKKYKMERESAANFTSYWNDSIAKQLNAQIDLLEQAISGLLLARHPWLDSEQEGKGLKLKDLFLKDLVKKYLFELLEKKANVKNWRDIAINQDTKFSWREFSPSLLVNQIEGMPLANADYYEDRNLPSFLDDPFTKSPTRYDIYRFIKNSYVNKFKPKNLGGDLFCTEMAPLHYSELAKLQVKEWQCLTSILLNIGAEDDPIWVLLDKKNQTWNLYSPSFLTTGAVAKCNNIEQLASLDIHEVAHSACNNSNDWNVVVLSRVLPWTQLSQTSGVALEDFRATVPVAILLQNSIEASCLKAQQSHANKATHAFAFAYPLSNRDLRSLYFNEQDIAYLLASTNIPTPTASRLLEEFDSRNLIFDPELNKLIVKDNKFLKEAMRIVYHLRISTLDLREGPSEALRDWFAYNLELTAVLSDNNPKDFGYVHACAARNRFIQEISPNYLVKYNNDEILARKDAWKNTGQFIYNYFKNLNEIDDAQLKNIAEMGEEGLKHFFAYLKTLEEAPNLECALDLNCGYTSSTHQYINKLAEYINDFIAQGKLFAKLELTLPSRFDLATETEFFTLLDALNQDLELVTFKNMAGVSLDFLKHLHDYVASKKLCLQIVIPEWDQKTFADNLDAGTLKAEYRRVQNKILENIRIARNSNLEANTKTIDAPEDVIKLKQGNAVSVNNQLWRPNIAYQLASSSVGVQQQAQQEVMQEAQQKQEKQSAPRAPLKREIKIYDKDSLLISRDNLENYAVDDASFSAWVGSNKDADYLIQKIDKAALRQIQAFPEIFKFGIDPERTPGFRLYYTSQDDKSLILSFEPELVEEDLLELKADPFAVRMNSCENALPFSGDFRQFEPFAILERQDSITSWHHLAKEPEFSKEVNDWLANNSVTSSAGLQCLNYAQEIRYPEDTTKMIAILKKWSHIDDADFHSALFANLNEDNLRSFGQLFYHYSEIGNKKWLQLAHKLYKTFSSYFEIYKQYLLDPLKNWSECLEQSEVRALTACIAKLEDQPIYSNILWKLIEAHGKSVGRMRFSEVWCAYEKVIDYLNANNLDSNLSSIEQEFLDCIKKYGENLNATQFLRRIYEVLQVTGNRQDSDSIQEEIVTNLSEIDWHENGFYYACIHENYRYWDPSLKLENLDQLGLTNTPSYIAKFDGKDLTKLIDIDAYTLRYAAQHLKLNKLEFVRFKNVIIKIPKDIKLMRLVLASLALGLDTIEDLESCDWSKFNNLNINQAFEFCLSLDAKDLKTRTYQVKLSDLPTLLTAINESQLDNLNLNIINALGRALQSNKTEEKSLKHLIEYAKTHGFESPLFTSFPWLVHSNLANIPNTPVHQRFYLQLQSLDFANSILPDADTLQEILINIKDDASRRRAVKRLLDLGCKIRDQDAEYRILNTDDAKLIDTIFLAKTFKNSNINLLTELFTHLAVKQADNDQEQIKALLNFLENLDRKNYYDELGQILGLLIEKAKDNRYYSVEQLTTWLTAVFDENSFKSNPYPVPIIKELLNDNLNNPSSSLLNSNLHHLKISEPTLAPLANILAEINLLNLGFVAKDTIVKVVMQYKNHTNVQAIFTEITNIFKNVHESSEVANLLATYINKELKKSPAELLSTLKKLTNPVIDANLHSLLTSNQIKILELLIANKISLDVVNSLLDIDDKYAQMILIAAFAKGDSLDNINDLHLNISRLNLTDKQYLADYYIKDPRPNFSQLKALLTRSGDIDSKLDYFEMVIQANTKRHYSLETEDRRNLIRVLNGIKLNKQPHGISQTEQEELLRLLYYCNNYSQVSNLATKSIPDILEIVNVNKKYSGPESKARILACIREIIVRKTGKWINHTQMIDLIYSALHNNDSLLHQIHTGEGKSIIGIARDVYNALHGEIIDVFSSKESLSARDHIGAIAVLDTFGIRHSHITADSSAHIYINKLDANGVGAVHFATIGNWSLFYSGVRWNNTDRDNKINVYQQNRRARCDEGDYIMRIENTLFNFSDQDNAQDIYNYDSWVYQIAYNFYLQNQARFAENDFNVYEQQDLQALYCELQTAYTKIAPDKSTFFQKYLATGDDTVRNNKLVGLLTAAHRAQKLEPNVDFCVMNEQKKISETSCVDVRFAKVMINNQVIHGATYSDLVQQFLHVRLNVEAVNNHEIPNFFIEPESEIALTANAKYILKNYYNHLEAATGTPGDIEALKFYRDEFGIFRLIKLPTHAEIKTVFLPPIFVATEANTYTSHQDYINAGRKLQVEEIIKAINVDPDQPVLITCEDDREVKILGELIVEALGDRDPKAVIDTNASGISEDDILKDAGNRRAITISSRLGRGSDIVPYDKNKGLKVLRTYPAIPEIIKQEEGRQGRNAAGGTCQDILNYNAISIELEQFIDNADFKHRYGLEEKHLQEKLDKHAKLGNKNKLKWAVIREDSALRTKYLQSRTLQYIKNKLKSEAKALMEQKDNLFIEGSATVADALFSLSLEEQDALRRAWKQCRRDIENYWQNEGAKSRAILQEFYNNYALKPKPSKKFISPEIPPQLAEQIDKERIEKLLSFHQTWLKDILEDRQDAKISAVIYGEDTAGLADLCMAFHKLDKSQLDILSKLVAENSQLSHRITCNIWVKAIDSLIADAQNFETNIERVNVFLRKQTSTPNTVDTICDFSQKFLLAVEGAPDVDFVLEIASSLGIKNLDELINQRFGKEIVYLFKNQMNTEDRKYFLTILSVSTIQEQKTILSCLQENFEYLKNNRSVVRPLIQLVNINNYNILKDFASNKTLKSELPYLFNFLSKRPYFKVDDYNDLLTKISDIEEPFNRRSFLAMLSTIAPSISVRSILNDLYDLPSIEFAVSEEDLKLRVQEICAASSAFKDLLFAYDIIKTNPRYFVVNQEAYKEWEDIYLSPDFSLEMRKLFFTQVASLKNINQDAIKVIATNYIKSKNNQELLKEVEDLRDPQTRKLNKENISNVNNNPTKTNSGFGLFKR